jgi:UDP-N-acetylmuramate--alanine ligase
VILDVYPAREAQEDYPGVTGLLVAEAAADAGNGKRVAWMPGHETAEAFLRGELREGDLLLTMGAGDVDRVGRALVTGYADET